MKQWHAEKIAGILSKSFTCNIVFLKDLCVICTSNKSARKIKHFYREKSRICEFSIRMRIVCSTELLSRMSIKWTLGTLRKITNMSVGYTLVEKDMDVFHVESMRAGKAFDEKWKIQRKCIKHFYKTSMQHAKFFKTSQIFTKFYETCQKISE